jgi:hypothetical protein
MAGNSTIMPLLSVEKNATGLETKFGGGLIGLFKKGGLPGQHVGVLSKYAPESWIKTLTPKIPLNPAVAGSPTAFGQSAT